MAAMCIRGCTRVKLLRYGINVGEDSSSYASQHKIALLASNFLLSARHPAALTTHAAGTQLLLSQAMPSSTTFSANPCKPRQYPDFQETVTENANAIKRDFSHLNSKQTEARNLIATWSSMMSEVRNTNIQHLLSESSQGTLGPQWFAYTLFFPRGPTRTVNDRVICALMPLLFRTRNMKYEMRRLKELCYIGKVFIFSESKDPIDARMNSIILADICNYSGEIYLVVRVEVHLKDAEVQKLEIENTFDAEERIQRKPVLLTSLFMSAGARNKVSKLVRAFRRL